ncbi:unnamed protein product, partial [Gulo gulo]
MSTKPRAQDQKTKVSLWERQPVSQVETVFPLNTHCSCTESYPKPGLALGRFSRAARAQAEQGGRQSRLCATLPPSWLLSVHFLCYSMTWLA